MRYIILSFYYGFCFYPIYLALQSTTTKHYNSIKPRSRLPWEENYPQDDYFTLREIDRIMKSRKIYLESGNDVIQNGRNDLLYYSFHKVVKHKLHEKNLSSMTPNFFDIIYKSRSARNLQKIERIIEIGKYN